MRKITFLIALFVCSIGFSQSSTGDLEADRTSVGPPQRVTSPQPKVTNQNLSSNQTAATFDARAAAIQEENQVLIVNSGVTNSILTGVSTYSESLNNGNSQRIPAISNDRPTLVVSSNRSSGVIDPYTDLATFQANVGGTLVSEIFDGGPGGITACGPLINSDGDGTCYGPGELEEGFDMTASNATDIIHIGAGEIGNTSILVGANTFAEFTVITFTGDPVFEVGHDIWNNSDPDTAYRVFDTGGLLIQDFNLNNTVGSENFFGIISPVQIGSIEIDGLNASGELLGNFLFTAPGGGGGGGACPSPVLEVNQDITDTCMALVTQTDLAQSYVAVEPISAGAGIEFQALSTGLDVTLSLWDALPNAGGTMLASGTSQTDGVNLFTDVFWDPVVNVTPGDTYFIVIDGDPTLPCVSGSTADPYPGGNVFANAGFTPFPGFDYTFRTYSCDGGGGGTCTPGSLETTFAGGNGNFGNMFDVNSLTDLTIDSFDINGDTGATFDVEVYAKSGTYIGFETDPGAWTLIGTAPGVVSNGDGVATPLNLMLNYAMAAGETHAFYVTPTDFTTGGFNYTNGTAVGDVFASDANLEFLEGAGSGYPFDGTLFSPRVFNGNILYCVDTGGPTCDVVQYDAAGLPADIDPGGTSTGDCVGAPNLYPVTVGDPGTIGVDSNIDNVTITITHTFDGDLDIFLVAPDGTELILSDQNGGGGDDYIDTVFMDGGADITAGSPPFTGTFEPEGGTFAAAFDGVDIQGDWSLKVCDNFGGDTGTVDSFSLSICRPEPPNNDECVDAFAIACGDVVVGETTTDTDSGGNPANDEWYSFTGSGAPQLVTLSLCDGGTDYDSLLRVFDACGGNEIATNDDACGLQSELSFLSDGTSTYYVMVEGFGSNDGNFSLAVSCIDPPPNDECAGAIDIACGETVVGETDTASFDAAAPVCVTGITAPGVWYTFTDDTGLITNYTLSMCDGGTDYDSKITVYSGDCGALACVVDNDDSCGLQSEVAWQGDGSTTYYILVHGFGASTGNFSMALDCAPVPPPNDMIVNSIDVDEIGFPYTDPAVAMPAATTEDGNPADCNIDGANGVWYNFVPDGDGFATATIISPAGASFVNFFSADDESATEDELTLVPFNGNQCAPQTDAIIPTTAGQAYYVFVVNTEGITDIVIDGNNLGTNENAIEGFTYYPNPTTNVLNLNSIDTIDNVAIYNILGQQVLNTNVAATSGTLDVSNLAVGAYIMKVSVNGEIGTYKIIKR